LTDEQLKSSLENVGQGDAFTAYATLTQVISQMIAAGQSGAAEHLKQQRQDMMQSWEALGWINRAVQIPAELMEKVRERRDYARRFDPIRLGVEHALLAETRLVVAGGLRKTTDDLVNPLPDIAPEGTHNQEGKEAYQKK
jgi:hypothetical protein